MVNKNLLVLSKAVFGLVALYAIVTEMVVLSARQQFRPINFFSFFTIESNLFAAIILLLAAGSIWLGVKIKHLEMLRGAAALYMIITGIVFSVLLSGLEADVLTAVPLDNFILHYAMPLAVVLDWLIDPPRRKIAFKKSLVWLSYPIIFLVYTFIHGAIAGWYPYPFLDPSHSNIFLIGVTCIGIALLGIALAWALGSYTRLPAKRLR